MHKLLSLFAAALFATMALTTTASDAEARRYRHGHAGGAIAAAIIGGIVLHSLHRRHHRRHYYSYYDGYDYDYYPRRRYYSSYSYAPVYGGYGFSRGHRHHHHGHHRGHWGGRHHR